MDKFEDFFKDKKDKEATSCSTFPWDIICKIIAFADLPTRRTLALLNRDCNFETNKYSWKKLRINNKKEKIPVDKALHRAAIRISRDGIRAKNVRSLEIELVGKPSRFRRVDMGKTMRELCQALQCLTSLRVLYIRMEFFHEELARLMSTYEFDFKLAFLATTIYVRDGFHGFMASHPEIRSFSQISKSQHVSRRVDVHRNAMAIDTDLLPNLCELWTTADVLPMAVTNRPVVSLGTHIFSHESTIKFLTSARLSAANISHVALSIKVDRGETFYETLFHGLARITTLNSVHIDLWSSADTVDHTLLPSVLLPLSLFPSLQKLEFGGNETLNLLRDPAPFSCETLRIVDIYDYAAHGGRHFERTSTKSPWIETTASIVRSVGSRFYT